MERLMLDTSILVDAERRAAAIEDVVGDEDDIAIAAVTVAELLVGVELADGPRRRVRRHYVSQILKSIPSEPYDEDVAWVHARMLVHSRASGRPRGPHDLIIAATAVANARIVVTTDAPGFEGLPGVTVRSA